MDLNEAAQRILKHHAVLIVLLVALGLAVPVLMDARAGDTYTATARLTVGGADTRDAQEASALADTALGLATSPSAVGQAISDANVRRDVDEVTERVTVQPVGASGVLQLTVTDPEPEAATALVNALADAVVGLRSDAVLSGNRELLASTEEQIEALTQNISAIETQLERPGAPFTLLDSQRTQALAQRSVLDVQRQQVTQTLANAVEPQVIDDAGEADAVPSTLPARLAVGALLGLLLGVTVAAALEALRPTLGSAALARQLGAPLLGHLPRRPERDESLPEPWLSRYVALAARDAGVASVQLVPVDPTVDVVRLADRLDTGPEGPRVVPLVLAGDPEQEAPTVQELGEPGTGVVVVAPDRVQTRRLTEVERHLQLTRRPLIGVISYADVRPGGRRGAAQSAPELETVAGPEHLDPATGPAVRPPTSQDARPAVTPAS